MMINNILQQLDKAFPISKDEVSEDYWKDKVDYFSNELKDVSDILFGLAGVNLPSRIFKESKIEYIDYLEPVSNVSTVRFRPQNEYYKNSTLEIPRPENPNGNDATGIELRLSLYRGCERNNQPIPPSFCIAFNVWGFNEREAFKNTLFDYRRPIELLIKKLDLNVETSCWFDNCKTYKGNNIIKKLDLYFQNEDPESNISLERDFAFNADVQHIMNVFLSLLTLYDSCYGYAKQPRDKNRILHTKLLKD